MNQQQITFGKLTIFHNAPDWRYKVLNKSKLLKNFIRQECSKTRNVSYRGAYLKRFIGNIPDISYRKSEIYNLSSDLTSIVNSLPLNLKNRFTGIQKLFAYKTKQKKHQYRTTIRLDDSQFSPFMQWQLKDLHRIQDKWLVKIIKTMSGIEFDEAIHFAFNLKADIDQQEILRYIGYHIFLGKTDQEIAVKWRLCPSYVTALRHLFFDFSRLPTDSIARITYFRQLVISGKFTEEDLEFYKLLSDLGDLGLKAISDSKALSLIEQSKVESYLGLSMIENVLKLKMSVRTKKDALDYNSVVNMLGTFYLKRAELTVSGAKVKNIEANTRRVETELGNVVKGDEHEKLVDVLSKMKEQVRELSLAKQPLPQFKTITDLK